MNTLYNELCELVRDNDAFYVSDQADGADHYEIFLYRLASYTDFQQEGAMEARGIMFKDGVCVSRPMEKFHNFHEISQWPEYKDTDWSEYTVCQVKEDGSLISTWIDSSDKLRCKSKGSLWSGQALMADEVLISDNTLRDSLDYFTRRGYTVNCELVSPDNRIVLPYTLTELVILNIRDTLTGTYLSKDDAYIMNPNIVPYWVEWTSGIDMKDVPSMNGLDGEVIEGFIFMNPYTNHKIKCKTDRYVEIHHAKDDINNPKRLMKCVLDEGSDDLRSLFENDPWAIKYIDDFEKMVFDEYNYMISIVEMYYKHNKDLIQKDYAIKAQDKANHISKFFSLAMMIYNGREVKYKEYMIKNRKSIFPEIKWTVD